MLFVFSRIGCKQVVVDQTRSLYLFGTEQNPKQIRTGSVKGLISRLKACAVSGALRPCPSSAE